MIGPRHDVYQHCGRHRSALASALGAGDHRIHRLSRSHQYLALPLIAEQFQWNAEQTRDYDGWLMSLFYLGYGLSGMLLTPWAARLGPRRRIALVILLAYLFTALGAVISQLLLLFLASRVLLGVVEGPHFPLSGMAIRHWF